MIAGDLLETIVGRLDPPFRLAKLEGDAAFLFVEDGRADGSLLLDAVEAAYVAFRRRLRSIDQATSCDCNSCRLAPRLDLKLFVHHGSYVRGRIAGRDELAGADVIVVHRLLKGETAGASRANGFALLTSAAVDALRLDPDRLGLSRAEETIEHLGRVSTFVLDLEARWQAESSIRRLDAGWADGEPLAEIDTVVAADPATVWAHLTSPGLRATWEGPIVFEEALEGGRRGVGSTRPSASRAGSRPSRRSWTGSPRTTWPGDSWSRASDRSRPPPTSRSSGRARDCGSDGRPRPKRRSIRPMPGGSGRTRRRRRVASRASRPARCRSPTGSAPGRLTFEPHQGLLRGCGSASSPGGSGCPRTRSGSTSGRAGCPRRRGATTTTASTGTADAEHLRLLIDLRRLDVPLDDAAQIASWCHSGHCAEATSELPRLIADRRTVIADRVAGLQALDATLSRLERHLRSRPDAHGPSPTATPAATPPTP